MAQFWPNSLLPPGFIALGNAPGHILLRSNGHPKVLGTEEKAAWICISPGTHLAVPDMVCALPGGSYVSPHAIGVLGGGRDCRVSLGLALPPAQYLQACWAGEIRAGVVPLGSPGTALASAAFETDPRADSSVTAHLSCPHPCGLEGLTTAATPIQPMSNSSPTSATSPVQHAVCPHPSSSQAASSQGHFAAPCWGTLTHDPALSSGITNISPSNQAH